MHVRISILRFDPAKQCFDNRGGVHFVIHIVRQKDVCECCPQVSVLLDNNLQSSGEKAH